MLEDHLTFFIDLLGFSNEVHASDALRTDELKDFMIGIASMRRAFHISEVSRTFDERRIELAPEVSTFSDNIVISYRLSGDVHISMDGILQDAIPFVMRVAAAALSLDMLLRGGATIGPLHHADGVVFGKAMVEAYELESRVASYPRIVLTRSICGKVRSYSFTRDQDGISYLNYYRPYVQLLSHIPGHYEELHQKVSAKVSQFEASQEFNKLSKWAWFQKVLEQEKSWLDNAGLENV